MARTSHKLENKKRTGTQILQLQLGATAFLRLLALCLYYTNHCVFYSQSFKDYFRVKSWSTSL